MNYLGLVALLIIGTVFESVNGIPNVITKLSGESNEVDKAEDYLRDLDLTAPVSGRVANIMGDYENHVISKRSENYNNNGGGAGYTNNNNNGFGGGHTNNNNNGPGINRNNNNGGGGGYTNNNDNTGGTITNNNDNCGFWCRLFG